MPQLLKNGTIEILHPFIQTEREVEAIDLMKHIFQFSKGVHHMKWTIAPLGAAALAVCLALGGCSSSPSKDDLSQLDAMRAETASLQQRASTLEQEKAQIEKKIAQDDAAIHECQLNKKNIEEHKKSEAK
jgi:predicted exporter